MSNPLVATAAQVLNSARTHLNDELGLNWNDTKLLPKLQEAHRELRAQLVLVGIPVVDEFSIIMTVPALTTDDSNQDLSVVAGYPTDMIIPIWIKERQVGQRNVDFHDMTQVDTIPYMDKSTYLGYWAWLEEVIVVRGALNSNQIQIKYGRNIPTPVVNTDNIGFMYGELFLSYRTAALAAGSTGNDQKNTYLTSQAERNLDTVIRMNIKSLQNLPAKRRPYHRGKGRNRVIRAF